MVLEYHEIATTFFSDFRATVIVMFKCLYGLGGDKGWQIFTNRVSCYCLFSSVCQSDSELLSWGGGDEGLDLGHFFVNCHSEFMAK